jgi:serine protease Do
MRRILQRLLGFAFVAAMLACSRDGQAATSAGEAAKGTPLFREAAQTQPAPVEAGVPVQTSLAPLIERLKPSVVNISTTTVIKHPAVSRRRGGPQGPQGSPDDEQFQEFFERYFGRQPGPEAPQEFRGSSLGSGFVLNAEGYILTNAHVVKDAADILVRLTDGREFKATRIGADALTDVALIKLANPPKDLPAVTLGDSDAVRQGDFVLALGSPFGLTDTATLGIVSAKHRQNVSAAPSFDDFLQTDAAINQGNSGGPLFNLRGEVIGINTAIVSPQLGQGIGFAVPINIAKALLPQLREKGKVSRGFMGVSVQPLTPDLARAFSLSETQKGALVQNVVPNSPAAKAGMEPGDVVLSVNGKEIDSAGALTRTVSLVPPGGKVDVQFLRNGQKKSLAFAVGTRPDEEAVAGRASEGEEKPADVSDKSPKLGVSLAPITAEMAKEMEVPAGRGVAVVSVVDGGPAERAGIRSGDVILEVNRKPVNKPDEVASIVGKMKDGEPALLRVQRGETALFLTVPVGGRQ